MRTKRKYNKRRQVNNQWFFGGIDRETKDCFAVLVDHGDAVTLLLIIGKFILSGTTIYSDQWKAYNYISRLPHDYTHETVNHSLNVISPETLAHTQNVENMWMCPKMKKKIKYGATCNTTTNSSG